MARLQFDGNTGSYVGADLMVAGSAVSRRISQLTAAQIEQGIDPVDAAEEAWNAALDEATWSAGEDGVAVRPPEHEAPATRH